MKCHYCDQDATQYVVWLKDKQGRNARIALPWCGCDLMEALRKTWPCPYPVVQGTDYEIEAFSPQGVPILTLQEKLDALAYCIKENAHEDTTGHLCDLLAHFGFKIKPSDGSKFYSLEQLVGYYGRNPTPIKP